ncbi:MAG TPA: hypothetical protein DCL66_01635 [Gammaproteobacteria bacterium]|nr:hypothetical protein [Gammaproteobacteria bacterium]
MRKSANGWQRDELEQLEASSMEVDRIHNLINNINNNLKALHNSPVDARKLRDLKIFFQNELKKRCS